MTRGIYTKWIIGAVFILLIVATGCILYYQQTTAADRHAAAQAEKRLQKLQADKAKPPTPAETESTQAPAETPNAEKPTNQIGEGTETNTDNSTEPVTIATPAKDNTEDVKMSPYGFGPYPEIPADFPFPVEWEFQGSNANHELIARVAIKLWTQGIETMGATMEDGWVYPNYIDTVYIRWAETTDDDDNPIQYINELGGYPPACQRIESNNIARHGERRAMTAEDIPSDITVKLYDQDGIDPYTFLDLPK